MLLNRAETDILRLAAWCKDLPRNVPQYVHAESFRLLLDSGFLRGSKCELSYRPTQSGLEILSRAGFEYPADKQYLGKSPALIRRLELAELCLFLYMTGADVFLTDPTQGRPEALRFLPSFALRRQKASNILGGTRLAGFLYAPQTTFVPYFIRDGNDGIYPHIERMTFSGEHLSNRKPPAVIYTGKPDLRELLDTVRLAGQADFKTKAANFREAISQFVCPVCFVPMNENGARQLRIMCVPDYKIRLAKAVLGDHFTPSKYPWCESVLDGGPFVTAVDCDIYIGIERALKFANGKKLHLLVLDFQREMMREILYGKNVTLYPMSVNEAEAALGLPEQPRPLDFAPFQTEEGGYVNVTAFKADRKAGAKSRQYLQTT